MSQTTAACSSITLMHSKTKSPYSAQSQENVSIPRG